MSPALALALVALPVVAVAGVEQLAAAGVPPAVVLAAGVGSFLGSVVRDVLAISRHEARCSSFNPHNRR